MFGDVFAVGARGKSKLEAGGNSGVGGTRLLGLSDMFVRSLAAKL
jgi:hypothetical protein